MNSRIGQLPTDRPARYAKQLTSHWAARGQTVETDGVLTMTWHSGQVIILTPEAARLVIQVSVPEGGDIEHFAGVVARHLERFGQRDELQVSWEHP
ncbi:MAG: DUF2218 domain-containing protein [Actinomycetales bacterium]